MSRHRTFCVPIHCAWRHSAARRLSGITHFQCSDSLRLETCPGLRSKSRKVPCESHRTLVRCGLPPLLSHFPDQLKLGKNAILPEEPQGDSQGRLDSVAAGGGVSAANVATHLRCSDSLCSLLSHFPNQLKLGKIRRASGFGIGHALKNCHVLKHCNFCV